MSEEAGKEVDDPPRSINLNFSRRHFNRDVQKTKNLLVSVISENVLAEMDNACSEMYSGLHG